jgi:hypothetical protein
MFFHAFGMFIEKFICSKEWNKVALELKKKKKKDVVNKRGEKKMQNKKQFIYFIVMFWPNHLGLLGASQCGWNSGKGPNSVRQNPNLTKNI